MAGSVNSIPGKGDPAGAHKLWNFERATLARDARRCQPTQGDSKASVAERRFTARIQACTIGTLLQRVAYRGDHCSRIVDSLRSSLGARRSSPLCRCRERPTPRGA